MKTHENTAVESGRHGRAFVKRWQAGGAWTIRPTVCGRERKIEGEGEKKGVRDKGVVDACWLRPAYYVPRDDIALTYFFCCVVEGCVAL